MVKIKLTKNARFILAFSSRLKGSLLFQSIYSVCSKTQLDEKYSIRDKSIIYYIILNKSLKKFLSTEITHVWQNQTGSLRCTDRECMTREMTFPKYGFQTCPGTTRRRCSFNSHGFSAFKRSIMLWNPLSIFHGEKNIPVQHLGPLVGYSLHCACTATARLWKPTCPKCRMQSIPRNWTGSLWAVILSWKPGRETEKSNLGWTTEQG